MTYKTIQHRGVYFNLRYSGAHQVGCVPVALPWYGSQKKSAGKGALLKLQPATKGNAGRIKAD
jgi:hypothetical protein